MDEYGFEHKNVQDIQGWGAMLEEIQRQENSKELVLKSQENNNRRSRNRRNRKRRNRSGSR